VAVIDFVLSSESEFTALLERLLTARGVHGVSDGAAA
jgi:hypothetical protein